FAMMTAILLPTLLASVGLALDTANIVSAKSRLQNIADTAVLAASNENTTDANREKLFESFIASQNAAGLKVLETELEFHEGLNYVQVQGTVVADVELYLMNHFGSE